MRILTTWAVPRGLVLTLAALLTALLLASALLSGRATAASHEQQAAQQLVVVELFTSQGCSSCPPADALLGELASRPNVLPLSLHVDYWDYIGWKDPYGSPMNTSRQRQYAESLGLRYVFTPQMIIDGQASVVGSRRGEILDAVETAANRPKALNIQFLASDGGKVVIPAGQAPDSGATVWLAVYDRAHETEVKRGENAGRRMLNTNVVRSFERLGTWMGERLEIPLDLNAAAARGRDGCAVIVQQGRTGPVLGAAAMALETLEN